MTGQTRRKLMILALRNVVLTTVLAASAGAAPVNWKETPTPELLKQFVALKVDYTQTDVVEELSKRPADKREIIDAMLPHLRDDDRRTRCGAGFVLATFGDDRGFDAIVKELNDDRPRTPDELHKRSDGRPDVPGQIVSDRYYAALMLARLKDSRAVPDLIMLLDHPRLDYQAAYALGMIGSHEALEPLKATTGPNANAELRVFAFWALAKLGERSGVDGMLDVLKSGKPAQRWRSAEMLGELKDPRILPALCAALAEDEDPTVRRRAISGLVRLGDPAALPALEKALKGKTPGVSRDERAVEYDARAAIERLTKTVDDPNPK